MMRRKYSIVSWSEDDEFIMYIKDEILSFIEQDFA